MVALLWSAGNVDGTLALEQLWNALRREVEFPLLCACALTNLDGRATITDLHEHVVS